MKHTEPNLEKQNSLFSKKFDNNFFMIQNLSNFVRGKRTKNNFCQMNKN